MTSAAKQIRTARARAGLTQRQLAAQSGIPQPNIAAIESGHREPNPVTVDRLLTAASVRPSRVLEANREEVRRAITAAGGRNPRVFGSVAQGSDTPGSDLDLLIDLGESGIWRIVALIEELQELLCVHVDIVDDFGSSATIQAARAEAVAL